MGATAPCFWFGDSVTAAWFGAEGIFLFDRLAVNPPEEWPDMQGLSLSRVFPDLLWYQPLQYPEAPHLNTNRGKSRIFRKVDSNTLSLFERIHRRQRLNPQLRTNAAQGRPQCLVQHGKQGDHQSRQMLRLDRSLAEITRAFPGGCPHLSRTFTIQLMELMTPAPSGYRSGRRNKDFTRLQTRSCNAAPAQPHKRASGQSSTNLSRPRIDLHLIWRSHYRRDDPHYWWYFVNLKTRAQRGLRRHSPSVSEMRWRRFVTNYADRSQLAPPAPACFTARMALSYRISTLLYCFK